MLLLLALDISFSWICHSKLRMTSLRNLKACFTVVESYVLYWALRLEIQVLNNLVIFLIYLTYFFPLFLGFLLSPVFLLVSFFSVRFPPFVLLSLIIYLTIIINNYIDYI